MIDFQAVSSEIPLTGQVTYSILEQLEKNEQTSRSRKDSAKARRKRELVRVHAVYEVYQVRMRQIRDGEGSWIQKKRVSLYEQSRYDLKEGTFVDIR